MEHEFHNWVVDPQLQSPLYSTFPAEIRLLIFELALAEVCENPIRHNFRVRYDHDGDPLDDGALDSVESASFTDSDDEEDDDGESSDHEDQGVGTDGEEDLEQTISPTGPEIGGPFNSFGDFPASESDDESYLDDVSPQVDPNSDLYTPLWVTDRALHTRRYAWARPAYRGRTTTNVDLLRTCRRIYIEARAAGLTSHTLRLWNGFTLPMGSKGSSWDSAPYTYMWIGPREMNTITSAHLLSRSVGVDGPSGLWDMTVVEPHNFRRIERLRITVPATASFPRNYDPFDLAQTDDSFEDIMRKTADVYKDGPPPEDPDADWITPLEWGPQHSWRHVFQYMPSLKKLVIDFDADEKKRETMGRAVEWATRVWRFPLFPRAGAPAYLSAHGHPVKKMSWRGTHFHAANSHGGTWCAVCHKSWQRGCPQSDIHIGLLERGYGLRVYTWTVTWTARVGKPLVSADWPGFGQMTWEEEKEEEDGEKEGSI